MPIAQSSELIEPFLLALRRERPDLSVYYSEIDHTIRKLLQKMLDDARYSIVTVQPLGENKGASNHYPYAYVLSTAAMDGEWAKEYLPNVRKELQRATMNTSIDLAYSQDGDLVLVRLKPIHDIRAPEVK